MMDKTKDKLTIQTIYLSRREHSSLRDWSVYLSIIYLSSVYGFIGRALLEDKTGGGDFIFHFTFHLPSPLHSPSLFLYLFIQFLFTSPPSLPLSIHIILIPKPFPSLFLQFFFTLSLSLHFPFTSRILSFLF